MSDTAELKRWNERFAKEGYHFGTQPNAFLSSQAARLHPAHLRPGSTALSVADGEGRNSVWLAERGLKVTAFDFSPVGVAKAQRLAAERDVEVDYRVCDIADWDWDAAQYDVIVGIFFQFVTPPQRARVFAGMCRALKPGGLLLLQGYTPEQLKYGTGGPRVADQLYTAELLRQSFAALDILELREHVGKVQEGDAHAGLSALIDFVARRPTLSPA